MKQLQFSSPTTIRSCSRRSTRLLEEADFEIVGEVSVGSHVLPAVNETHPDVVLLDVRMPELDGITCLQRLRKQDPEIANRHPLELQRRRADRAARVAGARAASSRQSRLSTCPP